MKIILLFALLSFYATNLYAQNEPLVVYFNFNKAKLNEEVKEALKQFISTNKDLNNHISLSGHTDSKGNDDYNNLLSKRRVNTVKDFLVENGFPQNLIKTTNAFGERKLILPNDGDTLAGAVNRRVEIIILKEDDRTIKEIIEDSATKKGSNINFKNMQFEGGRHIMLKTSLPQLASLLDALKSNSKLKIRIEGHICCLPDASDGTDNDTFTEDLSERRAIAIYEYLIQEGIDKERLEYKGFGHSKPLFKYPEKNEAERIMNRRVEIKILDK